MDGENLFRGPCPSAEDLKNGRYICLVGAAQLLGRFHSDSFQHKLARKFNLPVLNLSVPAAGPEFALSPKLRPYLENAQLTIVQVMSGRSIGCDEYPGGWKTTDLTTGELRPREAVLRSIWETDVEKFGQVLRRWNDNYIRSYHALASAIPGPKMLLRVSPRGPGEWSAELATQTGNFGTFPQLVGEDTYAQISPLFDQSVEVVHDLLGTRFLSRFTGLPCPFVEPTGALSLSNRYYPPQSTQDQLLQAVAPVVETLLSQECLSQPVRTAILNTADRPFVFEMDEKGHLCFTTLSGKRPEKAFVNSLPKAGTYFLGEILSELGWRNSDIHMSPFSLTDYRGRSLDEKLSKARQLSYPIGFDASVQFLKPGQFSVGHIAFSGRNRKLLNNFKVLLAVRRWRDCLASFMYFEAKRIALDPKRFAAEKSAWVSGETPQEKFIGYLEVFGEQQTRLAKTLVPWVDQDGVFPVKFEEIVGEFGKDAQDKCVTLLLKYLGIEPTDDAKKVVLDCVDTPTLTFSGGRSGADDLWSPEAQKLFQSFGGPSIEKRFGYV